MHAGLKIVMPETGLEPTFFPWADHQVPKILGCVCTTMPEGEANVTCRLKLFSHWVAQTSHVALHLTVVSDKPQETSTHTCRGQAAGRYARLRRQKRPRRIWPGP